METRKGAFGEMSATEYAAWQIGFNRGRQSPKILAGADDDFEFCERYSITPEMTAEQRAACVSGFDAGRATLSTGDSEIVPTAGDQKLLDEIHQFAQHVCESLIRPELASAGVPFYLVASSQTTDAFAADCDSIKGFTSPDADLLFQSHLEDSGRWRGRGVAIAVRDSSILAEAREFGDGGDRYIANRVCGIALHESAHRLVDGIAALPYQPDFNITERRAEHLEWQTAVKADYDPISRLENHGPAFVRAVLHLVSRAARLPAVQVEGVTLLASAVANADELGLDVRQLQTALGDELQDFTTPISAILSTPLPEEFARVFSTTALKVFTKS